MIINEQESPAIKPEGNIPSKERYYGTPYYHSYTKGMMAAQMTLDEKNKDTEILLNLDTFFILSPHLINVYKKF